LVATEIATVLLWGGIVDDSRYLEINRSAAQSDAILHIQMPD
jgi:hypothetical protein